MVGKSLLRRILFSGEWPFDKLRETEWRMENGNLIIPFAL
jgi:hypothetical protein